MSLLPCPFCRDESVYMEHNSRFFVACAYCGCFGPNSRDENEAATLWNTRPPSPTDLNQLKMCYEALSEEEKAFVHIKFAVPFNDMTNKWPSDRDNLFAVFTHPELVAKAILKAKGVS